MGFCGGSVVKNLPANAGDIGDVGLIPWTEEPDGLQCTELQRVGYDLAAKQ